MASGTWSVEVESKAPAAQLFKAACLDWHNLGPKVVPEIVVSGSPVTGDGPNVGSVRELKFTSALPFSYVKERLDFVDLDNFECTSSLVEGGFLGTKIESASAHYKLVPSSDGGCVVKIDATYKLLPGVVVTDEIEKAKEAAIGEIKAAEAYILANPTAYA